MLLTSILSGAILAGSVAAHGNIVIPAIRQVSIIILIPLEIFDILY